MRQQNMNRDFVTTASTLAEALPYMQRYAGAVVVVKFGGNAMGDDAAMAEFARDIVLMKQVGIHPVVVHGGGPMINDLLDRLGIESRFVRGKRVTTKEAVQVVEMIQPRQQQPHHHDPDRPHDQRRQQQQRQRAAGPGTVVLGGEVGAGQFTQVVVDVGGGHRATFAILVQILEQVLPGQLQATLDDAGQAAVTDLYLVFDTALATEVKANRAALYLDVTVAQGGQAIGAIFPRVTGVADPDQGVVQQHDHGGQHFLAAVLA